MADPKTREEVITISNRVAGEWGIPPALLLACGIAESNLRWNARRPTVPSKDADYWPDVSAGVWQQAVRYDPEYQGGSAYPGPAETERILQRQYDVERSAHVAAENLKRKFRGDPNNDADILRALYSYNWPAGSGRPYSPEHEANYKRGLAEARTILAGGNNVPTPLPFDPDARVDRQPDDWSCSIQSAEFLLRSIGHNPGDQWIQDQLLGAGIVTREHGLMDASGQQLADWITREYGAEMGFTAQASPVLFEDVYAGAGHYPGYRHLQRPPSRNRPHERLVEYGQVDPDRRTVGGPEAQCAHQQHPQKPKQVQAVARPPAPEQRQRLGNADARHRHR